MLVDVTARLASLGYTVVQADTWILNFIIDKVKNHIKSSCNLSTIPTALHEIAVDMVVGNFLFEKKAVDADSLIGFDLDAVVKQIQEGDTSVTYAIGEGSKTPEQRLDAVITWLMTYGEKDFAAYRCIAW